MQEKLAPNFCRYTNTMPQTITALAKERFDELCKSLHNTQKYVESWANAATTNLQELESKHAATFEAKKSTKFIFNTIEYVEQLTVTLEHFKSKAQQLDQQLAQELAMEDHVNQSLHNAKKTESQIPAHLHVQKQQYDQLLHKMNQDAHMMHIAREKRKMELAQKARVLSSYEKLLCMQFKACEQGVEVAFYNLVANNPQQQVSFCVGIDNKQYVLLSCSISVAYLPLLQELNQSNNFAKFVVCMRKKLKEALN